MTSTVEHIESIASSVSELAETKVELWKLKATSKVSEAVSSVISQIAIVLMAVMTVLIISVGAALWIGSMMTNTYMGFFIVGGVYVFAGLFVFIFRKSLISKPVSNLIIEKIINNEK